ncbi:MAG: GDP-mannose 4,6-dehydratase [Acidobacteriota bacterium]
MRVLITGITGFLGRAIARELLHQGHEVTGLASEGAHTQSAGGAQIDISPVDVRDPTALGNAVERAAPDAILHLAALSHVGTSWRRPGDYLRTNFDGTRHLLRAAAGRPIVFASSSEVYGAVPEEAQPIAESRPLAPGSPYAMTKACAERLALDAGARVVRQFNVVGPGQDRSFALPSFATQLAAIAAAEREPILRVGNLAARRDFVHIDDAARGWSTVLERGADATLYNLASGVDHSIAEALDRLIAISGVDVTIEVDPARVRAVDVPLVRGDATRLRALGWTPRHDLERALDDLWTTTRGGPR